MDESAARQVVLARAIETGDTDGEVLPPATRDQLDRQARQEALQRSHNREPLPPGEFVLLRARHVLAETGIRHPEIVALQQPGAWRPVLEWGVPIAALVTGVLTDVIGNPHRLDLVSLPLLGIVAWNVVMYLLLFGALLVGLTRSSRRGKEGKGVPWFARMGRFGGGGGGGGGRGPWLRPADARSRIESRFRGLWLEATQALHVERCKRVLHISAAAWAVGVILSLLVRGLVVEYRVGWESTFLTPEQVHAVLSLLRLPALLVLPFEPFTVADIAALRFSNGGGAGAGATGNPQSGAPWVWMYVALLLTVVVLPRLLLATWAALREGMLARRIRLDFADPYHGRIVSLMNATRVRIALLAHRDQDRDAVLRVLAPDPRALPVAVSTDIGDALLVEDLAATSSVPAPAPVAPWWRRMLSPEPESETVPPSAPDLVLHVVGSVADADAGLAARGPGRPVLLVRMPGVGEIGAGDAVLDHDDFAGSWALHARLFEAIGSLLPEAQANGYARIRAAIEARETQRLHAAMSAVARHLLNAARQQEEVASSALSVRSLLPAERDKQGTARQAAMDAIAQRVQASSRELTATLGELHGVDPATAEALEKGLEQRFVVQQSVHAPQAGMAGAATGAAMGASVDLAVGGMTLGAAAALGALVGGGAAFVAAAWRNRTAPDGGTMVQLGDAMLEALARGSIVRYFAIVHYVPGRANEPLGEAWEAEIGEALKARQELLAGFWNTARTQPETDRLVEPLASELMRAVRRVFERMQARL